ncbi:sialidase family protein [Pseudoalteromonas maricaloris]|uniref:sialidase family protein n=1 Tax=Pseudoalteromonas maricaloris TaxID=184924 RepID=UPI00029A7889|nr:sialidase family protein [Pseudoalteromonas flavipulchra]
MFSNVYTSMRLAYLGVALSLLSACGGSSNDDVDDINNAGKEKPPAEVKYNVTGVVEGLKAKYSTNELVDIDVNLLGDDKPLSSKDGWLVKYKLYQTSSTGAEQLLDERGGMFDQQTQRWKISFSASESAMNVKLKLQAGCSVASGLCADKAGSNKDKQWEQTFEYSVNAVVEHRVNVTNTTEYSGATSLISLENGDLVALYNHGLSDTHSRVSISSDNGQSWVQTFSLNVETLGDFAIETGKLFEDKSGNLLAVGNCNESSLCILKSDSESLWSKVSEIDFSNYDSCDGGVDFPCSNARLVPGSLIQLKNGKYMLSYLFAPGANSAELDVYIRISDDLVNWSEEKRVAGNGFDRSESNVNAIALPDGRVLLSYTPFDSELITILISNDGENFETLQKLNTASIPRSVSLINHNGSTRLFYSADYGNFYSSSLGEAELFTKPQLIKEFDYSDIRTSDEPLVTDLIDGTLGVIYTKKLNEQHDVFFENLGAAREGVH